MNNDPQALTLDPDDAAVIFRANGQLGMVVPAIAPGDPISNSALFAMCVREMAEDKEIVQKLVERLQEKGLLQTKAP